MGFGQNGYAEGNEIAGGEEERDEGEDGEGKAGSAEGVRCLLDSVQLQFRRPGS